MDPDDRAYVVGLAEELFGPARRGHRWPFLVDEDGVPLEVDAFWPDHGVAFALAGDDAERWHYAPFALNLRNVRLLLVSAGSLPTDRAGRLVRDAPRVRSALVSRGFPGTRAAFDELVGDTDGARAAGPVGGAGSSWTVAPLSDGPDPGWEAYAHGGDEVPTDPWEDDGPGGRAGARDEDAEPWMPDWRYDAYASDPWGDDHEDPDPFPEHDAVLELGARSRPIALAALGAVVLARRVLRHDALGEIDPTALQVLVALAVPDDEDAPFERANLRGLASRLALEEGVVRAVLDELVEGGRARATEDPVDGGFEVTPAGRGTVRAWLERIAPSFAGWPPENPDVDDAA